MRFVPLHDVAKEECVITPKTLRLARTTAEELRWRGEHDRAAIEALVAASEQTVPAPDPLTTAEAGDLFGATEQAIKSLVRRPAAP